MKLKKVIGYSLSAIFILNSNDCFGGINPPGTYYNWHDVYVDEMKFEPINSTLSKTNYTLVSVPNKNEIVIPDKIEATYKYTWTYNMDVHTENKKDSVFVTGIEKAFVGCSQLEKLHMNKNISGGSFSFKDCPNLKEIYVPVENEYYNVDNFALYRTRQNELIAVIPTKAEANFNIMKDIEFVEAFAFANCPISNITVDPDNKRYFSIDGILCEKWQTSVTQHGIRVVAIPPNRQGALSFPFTYDDYIGKATSLYQTSIDKIMIYSGPYRSSEPYEFLQYYPTDRKLYASVYQHDLIKKSWKGELLDINDLFIITDVKSSMTDIEFFIVKSQDLDIDMENVEIRHNERTVKKVNNRFRLSDLTPGSVATIAILFNDGYMDRRLEYKLKTEKPQSSLKLIKSTQTSVLLQCSLKGDENVKFNEFGVSTSFGGYYKADKDGYVLIDDLSPDTKFSVGIYGIYDVDKYYYSSYEDYIEASTLPISLNVIGDVGPTSIDADGICDLGDAELLECGFNSENVEGNHILLSGLSPNTEYSLTFYVKLKDGYSTSIGKTFVTLPIELETLKPRVVSSTNAIVAASTNISDVETNVGFQWKKYDAPASLAPNEGYAAIYDGQLEGYIKNLQPTSYYNVRAFYKSANEKYYYSDWVTFDPSDFSYFEPTVHTYPVEPSTDGSVNVKGYVLAGTDDITEQGFEYWSAAGGAKAKRMLAEAPAGPVSKIFATGQVMTATLTDLAPSTTYTLRAFVTTVAGVTYGEEQTFTTSPDSSGIIGIDPDMSEPEVTGYYDLNGRRHEEPFSGLNIIRYSDGTVRKVFFK